MAMLAQCLCGEIKFSVDKFLPLVAHCHCKMCQRFHGAAFSTYAEVKLGDFHWLSGKELLQHYRADNDSERMFCQRCGSSLLFESRFNREQGTIEVALAAFNNDLDIKANAHIYTASKACWYQIEDKLPQYKEYRE